MRPGEVPPSLDGQIEVFGTVQDGVEHGSVVLQDQDGASWQLGRAHAELVGHRVRVTGTPLHDVMTIAQQGVPLRVVAVEDLGPAGAPGA